VALLEDSFEKFRPIPQQLDEFPLVILCLCIHSKVLENADVVSGCLNPFL